MRRKRKCETLTPRPLSLYQGRGETKSLVAVPRVCGVAYCIPVWLGLNLEVYFFSIP